MTIFETLRLHQELAAAVAEWKRTRVKLATAATSPAFTGADVSNCAREHEAAIAGLLVAYDALADAQLPAVTIGNARRIGQLEGEVALQAISWYHAGQEGNSLYSRERAADQSRLLHEKLEEFVDELSRLGEPTA